MTFKEQVLAKYTVEPTAVEAGWKDIIKKTAMTLTGLMITTSAMGKHLDSNRLKTYESKMKQAVHTANDQETKYDFKVKEVKKGDIQYVDFVITVNGKPAGKIAFVGAPKTKTSDYSSFDVYETDAGKQDQNVQLVMESQVEMLKRMIQ